MIVRPFPPSPAGNGRLLGEGRMKRLVCSLDGTWNDEDEASPPTNVAKLHQRHSSRPTAAACASSSATSPASRRRKDERFASCEARSASNRRTDQTRLSVSPRYLRAGRRNLSLRLFARRLRSTQPRELCDALRHCRERCRLPVDEAWELYRQSDHRRDVDALARLSAACHYPVRIRCIGAWDTVGNIGNPHWPRRGSAGGWRFTTYDCTTPSTSLSMRSLSTKHAAPFAQRFSRCPKARCWRRISTSSRAWFPGTHADVGGGSPETELSDIALALDGRARRRDDRSRDRYRQAEARSRPDPLGLQHFRQQGGSTSSPVGCLLRLIDKTWRHLAAARGWFRSWRTGKLGPA